MDIRKIKKLIELLEESDLTEIEIVECNTGRKLNADKSIPMIGTDVKIITGGITEKIINKDVAIGGNLIFEAGKWLVNKKIPIHIAIEDFLRVHFGIFGFTKAGKSNLLSTLISKMIESSESQKTPVKIVIFDLMGEYNVLFVDQLATLKNSHLLAIGEKTYPGSVIDYLSNKTNRTQAIDDLIGSSLYPQELEEYRSKFGRIIDLLFENNKIKILKEPEIQLKYFLHENQGILYKGNTGNSARVIKQFIHNLSQIENEPITPILLNSIHNAIVELLNENINHIYLDGIILPGTGLTQTAEGNVRNFKDLIVRKIASLAKAEKYDIDSTITINDIIRDLNSEKGSSLLIVQSHDPDALRNFSYELGTELFESRRMNGVRSPLVRFILDEADEFIPIQPKKDSSYAKSVEVAHMLARRGRKFGIGIGIATQRTRYLNTSIMAQPHTYLVGKLPRKMDREVVQEAFGFSDEVLKQTFKFTKGDWLLASYDATGLTGVPIPIHAENANNRIKEALVSEKDDNHSL